VGGVMKEDRIGGLPVSNFLSWGSNEESKRSNSHGGDEYIISKSIDKRMYGNSYGKRKHYHL
jgi:hypothetical protein